MFRADYWEQAAGTVSAAEPRGSNGAGTGINRASRSDDFPTNSAVRAPHIADSGEGSGSDIRGRGAFELKFLLDKSRAGEIIDWAREHLQPDPHAALGLGDGYHVNGLYLDTPEFDVYHRTDFFRRRKYRLRRYGGESTLWLELKRKRKGVVRKRRIAVAESALPSRLLLEADPAWQGAWFRRRVDEMRLQPSCAVTYRRFARVGQALTGPIRLTIDSELCGREAHDWEVPSNAVGTIALLENRRVLELKFRGTMPALFRGLVQDFRLQLTSFSKYRECVEACVPLSRLAADSSHGAVNA